MYFNFKILVIFLFKEFLFVVCFRKVKLSDIQTLSLSKNSLTTSRHTTPLPQLNCIGGNAGCINEPNEVICYNRGIDIYDVQWECRADLDRNIKFGMLRMSCEGYEYPQDPFIVDNSCRLEYTLDYKSQSGYDSYYKNYYETNQLGNFLTLLIMAIIVLSIYKTCNKYNETRRRSYIPTQRGGELINEFNSYDYLSQYPAPPPYTCLLSDNENNDTSNNSGNNDTLNNETIQQTDNIRPGYETPPPEYEEDIKNPTTRS